ncbi:hypothetical protein ACIF6L_27510 [Kitasatospora sp. NPDC086009]|uniref:hypothetical protein n=1 Tax=unclassified Kitasatospora TaxID=2633591 RepID=UPI0037CC70BB
MFTSVFAPPSEPAPVPAASCTARGAGQVAAWSGRSSSPWCVTVPVAFPDGRAGTQTFVEWADSSGQAREAALLRADTPDALRRRRNAVILPVGRVTVEPWQRPAWW